ncbi:MAG: hypothetical protein AAB329_08020, partial [Pseudomonadota bacterium]
RFLKRGYASEPVSSLPGRKLAYLVSCLRCGSASRITNEDWQLKNLCYSPVETDYENGQTDDRT